MDFVIELENRHVVLIKVKSTKKIQTKHLSGFKAYSEEKDIDVVRKLMGCFESSKRVIQEDIVIYPICGLRVQALKMHTGKSDRTPKVQK